MGLISTLFERRASSSTLGHPRDPALADWFGYGTRTKAGVSVSESNALKINSVWACVQIISETLASLPFQPYRELQPRGRAIAKDHPTYRVMRIKPNPFMTPMSFWQTLYVHVLTWGNGFAEIVRDASGRVTQLWPLLPNRIRMQVFDGKLFYYVSDDAGAQRQLKQEQVFHLRGLCNDGLLGYSPVTMHRETLGLTVAAQEYRSLFFANDARPGGVIEVPVAMSQEAFDHLKVSWAEAHSGVNKNKVAILEEGAKWSDVNTTPKDAEFIAGCKFQIQEVARIFRVPLVLLQEHENSTSWGTGIEQFMLAFVTHTIRPWAVRVEEQAAMSLLTEAEQQVLYFNVKLDALLRADAKTRADFYHTMRGDGVFSANDILELEDMNPQPGDQGDQYWRPVNMVPADTPVKPIETAQ